MLGIAVAALASLALSSGADALPAPTRFVSTSGSDANACTRTRPCRTLQRAYQRSLPGTVVAVSGGTYPGQRIDVTPRAAGPKVVFRPVQGAKVTFESIRVARGSHIEFRGFRVTDDTYNEANARWIVYRWVSMRQFFIRGADHISYRGANVGPNASDDGMNWITAAYGTTDPAVNIVLDHVKIHGFRKHNAGAHIDCIGIDDVRGLVIQSSKIWNCEHFALLFGKDAATNRGASNVLVQNSFLDCCFSGYYSIGLGDVEGPMRIRFNSMTLGMGWLGGTVRNVVVDSNVISNNNAANCDDAVWRFNVVARGSACGGRRAATRFRDPPSNLHLLPRAAARGYGNRLNHPRLDIDGQRRPLGRRPDAGADEIH